MSHAKIIVSERASKSIRSIKTYSIDALSSFFDSLDISYRRVGREINADVDKTGHFSYKINPKKGVFFNTDGKSGTVSSLLKRLKADTSSIQTSHVNRSDDSCSKNLEISRIINDSRPFNEINESGRMAIEKYFSGRGLSLILPETARVSVVPSGYDLIIPLFEIEKTSIPAVHVTLIAKSGEKRPQAWLDGKNRYTKGNLKTESESLVFSHINGAPEQLSVFENSRWIGIGEGLETVLSGRILSGWSSIFAISDIGIKTFFDNQKNLEPFKKTQTGLAIFVDRDLSEAGQKASAYLVTRAKEAGIPVLFIVPPSIIKGGKKGADWNDAIKELGIDGAKAALMLAISRSEEELSKIETGKIVPLENVRDSETSPIKVSRIPVDKAFLDTRSIIKDFLDNKKTAPTLLQTDMGVGKSHAISDLSKDHAFIGPPVVTITPTKELANEAAVKSGGLFREGRSENPGNAGFCPIYPDIEPYSERWRSIVAHKCSDCQFGEAAMDVIRGESTGDDPCQYILHVSEARQAPVLTTTAAMLEGDPFIGKVKDGEKIVPAKVVLDDTAEISDHRSVHGGCVAEWIRAANRIIETSEGNKDRSEATKALLPWLSALSHLLASNPGEEQIRLNPAEWTDFSRLVKSSALKWVDGITAEAIFRDSEGGLEIPLRTLKALGEAVERGTAWVRKGVLHFAVSTRAVKAIEDGALILDATPSLAVRLIVESLGGDMTEIRARQDSLQVTQVLGAGHGKTACSPDSPSFEREKMHFLNTVRSTAERVGAEKVAVLTHKALADSLSPSDLPEGVELGHWGLDDRGHNRWEKKKALLIWGIQQLSPSVAERHYMSDRQAVIEAGGPEWPTWDGSRTERWYQVPGQKKEIFAQGYKNNFIDFWNREWTTRKVVQAIGRLRATRRDGEDLNVVLHASFPLTESYGLEITSVERPDWRTMGDYQTTRKSEQMEKGVIAFRATKEGSRREANNFLRSIGMTGFKPEAWVEIKKSASGSRHEYSLYLLGTRPDLFGKDIQLLIEAMRNLASYAKEEGLSIEDIVKVGLVDPDYAEIVAIQVLRVSSLKNSYHPDDWRDLLFLSIV